MIVRAIWEFDVDDSEMNEKNVDVKGLCEDLTKRELDYCLKHNELNADDFIYECHPELPSDYEYEDMDISPRDLEEWNNSAAGIDTNGRKW